MSEPSKIETTPEPVVSTFSRPLTYLLAAGVAAGMIAWLGGEACHDVFQPRKRPVNMKGIMLQVASPRQQEVAEERNAGLAFVWLGAALGGCCGVAGGLARRDRSSGLRAAGFGAVAGAVGCAAVSLALLPLYDSYRRGHPDEAARDVIYPLLVHGAIWSVAGAAGGAAFGLGGRRILGQAAIGGLLGALAGTIAYELIGVAAFPGAGTTQFVSSTWPTRLLARLAVGVFAAGGIARSIAPPRSRPQRGSTTS